MASPKTLILYHVAFTSLLLPGACETFVWLSKIIYEVLFSSLCSLIQLAFGTGAIEEFLVMFIHKSTVKFASSVPLFFTIAVIVTLSPFLGYCGLKTMSSIIASLEAFTLNGRLNVLFNSLISAVLSSVSIVTLMV